MYSPFTFANIKDTEKKNLILHSNPFVDFAKGKLPLTILGICKKKSNSLCQNFWKLEQRLEIAGIKECIKKILHIYIASFFLNNLQEKFRKNVCFALVIKV